MISWRVNPECQILVITSLNWSNRSRALLPGLRVLCLSRSDDAIKVSVTFANIGLTHLHYHRWATRQVLEETLPLSAEQLVRDLKGSFPGIYDTLVHLYQADTVWLARLEGRPTGTLADYAAPGCTFELRDAWSTVQDRMIEWAAALDEDAWLRKMAYKSIAGIAYESHVWQAILHVVNHGTHHRGQVTGMLRQLGLKAVNLDLIAYYRTHP